MVLLIVAEGSIAALLEVQGAVKNLANGWMVLNSGVWVIGINKDSPLTVNSIRDRLGRLEAQVLVMTLAGEWAAKGLTSRADWLKSANHLF
jgi:hypothetical protein